MEKKQPKNSKARLKSWAAYREKNLEARREATRIYRKNNPDKVKESNRKSNQKRKTSLSWKLAYGLRNRIRLAVLNEQKTGSAVKDLGCSIEEFKLYLEAKFEPGMRWENWSKTGWHIDHIKPLSGFDLSNREQFLQAAHFSNLQPLWAVDNLKKGST